MDRRTFTKTSLLALLALGTGANAGAGLRGALAAGGACTRLSYRAEAEVTLGRVVVSIYAYNPAPVAMQYELEFGEGLMNRLQARVEAGDRVVPLDYSDPRLALALAGTRMPRVPVVVDLPPQREELLLLEDAEYDPASLPAGPATLYLSMPLDVTPAYSGRPADYQPCPLELALAIELPAAG